MTRSGSPSGLLKGHHAPNCMGDWESVACQPVIVPRPEERADTLEVVIMIWCEDCHAADWDWV